MTFFRRAAAGVFLILVLLKPAGAAPTFQQIGSTLVMSNANVRLNYNLNAGTADFYWQNSKKISAFYSGVTLNTGYIKGINYTSWSWTMSSSNQAVVAATGAGFPTMKQYFTLDQNDSFLVRVDVSGSNLEANWMGPVVVDTTGGVNIGITNDNRALVVPFDNDGFVSYNAMPMNNSATGYEVGAFYDNASRNGLVVGSVTHDVWKTGIFFVGANNKLNAMNVFGGATAPADVAPHGYVGGNTVSSPTMFVGFGPDWRVTMQDYAAENTSFVPRLPWTNGVPFGWNSWGVIQQNISYADAVAVSDFFYTHLMGNHFSDNGTVYINLDAFWNNNFSPAQLQDFVVHCHAHGQKAGIYWGPFVFFGTLTNATDWLVSGSTNYYYSDILLRTTTGNPESVDGGYAVDPTHPGTLQSIVYNLNLFTNWGFDYVKLDFLSHGALEGVHYDPKVTTGIEAYNEGMSNVLQLINGRLFISESIAPLFPYQYAHSRRIACDSQTSLITNTAYMMNSVSYGWWLDGLYQYNDPDIMVFNGYGATTNENQTRLISGAVTGLFLDGDDLTSSNGQQAAQMCLTNAAIDGVARVGQTFTPMDGNTGTSAVNEFVRQDGATWRIAVFNYTAGATIETVSLTRAGLPAGNYIATDLWSGTTTTVSGSFNVSLNANQSKLFTLIAVGPASLKWSGSGNSGVWDTGVSANWINLSNSLQTVFNANDQVLFDDTVGAPTTVSVSGTVLPNIITVDSSTNNFSFSGSGSISGAGGLVKEGSSTLTIVSPASFTGPVTISGGTIYAGDYSFTSVSSVTITNNSTLDLGGSTYDNLAIVVSGAGVNGQGAIYNSYNDGPGEVLNVTLAGNTTFGGNNRWDLVGGSISGPYELTVNWSTNTGYGEWNTATIAPNVGDIELANGKLGIKSMGANFGNPDNTFTVDSGTELDFWTGDPGYAKQFHVLTNGLFQILTGFTSFNGNFSLDDGANIDTAYGSGNQMMNGRFTLNGVAHFQLGTGNLIFTNVISGAGGFVWNDAYNHEMILEASNTYSGPTINGGGGPTLALTGSGSIGGSSLVFLGGSNSTAVQVDVSGRPDQTLTLASGQTLSGVGTVNGSLTVAAGAVLSPAGTNTTIGITSGANTTGIVAVTNAVVLDGATVIKLNGSGVNDQVQAGAGITYGGTLNLVNISGVPLAAGSRFQVFSASNYSGSFASITPASPGAGLAWDTSQLNTLGYINVVSQPVIACELASGGDLVFSCTNGTAGFGYAVLTTTNLATTPGNWTVFLTNTFDATGAFNLTNAIISGAPQQFYRIQSPSP